MHSKCIPKFQFICNLFLIYFQHYCWSLLVSQSVKIYKKGNGQTFIMIIRHHRYLCFYEKISSAASITSIAPPPFATAHFRRVCRLIFHEFINSEYSILCITTNQDASTTVGGTISFVYIFLKKISGAY